MSIIDLAGKKGLVIGIANDRSIAWGCAQHFQRAGAELAITYLNTKAEPHVRPLAESLGCGHVLPCDVTDDAQVAQVFDHVREAWGTLDFVLHSIAFAPLADLHGRVTDCSREGFLHAMDISCHSFIRMAKQAEALMPHGGSLLTVSYYGSEKVVPHYGIMGPVKAALEACVRYLAAELGSKHIRVNALSPGPMATRAASGIAEFEGMLSQFLEKSPLHQPLSLDDIGPMAAFLASDAARRITGGIHYIDGGYEVVD